ncbi:MAG: beta-lactamase family protein [Deltaproteobacteria bacterium]|nr:beta-lactamase family protein [Deltaproteobacteria bacterium]
MTTARAAALEAVFTDLVENKGINSAGAAVIKDGKIIWTGYFGWQSPGVPASRRTQFNVASLTKTVTTETILRLADQGKLDLDESMAPYWVDPDVRADPRHRALTPRMVLTHTTGFLNWRFLSDDFKLHFLQDPGSTYGYSGEGFKYLATFAEKKLGKRFDSLVKAEVFERLNMSGASITVEKDNFANIAQRLDTKGEFFGPYCFPQKRWCREEGSYSAAGDLVITVEDYATFLISVMDGVGYSQKLTTDRNRVQGDENKETKVDCTKVPADICPRAQGFGLGWEVFDYGNTKLVSHGGSNWAELTIAYFYTGSRDGLLILLSAPNERARKAMPIPLELIDPGSAIVAHYQRLAAR